VIGGRLCHKGTVATEPALKKTVRLDSLSQTGWRVYGWVAETLWLGHM